MSINQPQRDAACTELRGLVSELQQRIAGQELKPAELIYACRTILELWIESGGETTDDAVICFTGIESQTDHVLGGSRVKAGRDVDRIHFEPGSLAEAKEVCEIATFFDASFGNAVAGLAEHLTAANHPKIGHRLRVRSGKKSDGQLWEIINPTLNAWNEGANLPLSA